MCRVTWVAQGAPIVRVVRVQAAVDEFPAGEWVVVGVGGVVAALLALPAGAVEHCLPEGAGVCFVVAALPCTAALLVAALVLLRLVAFTLAACYCGGAAA